MDEQVAREHLANLKRLGDELLRLAENKQWSRVQALESQWSHFVRSFFDTTEQETVQKCEAALREVLEQHQSLIELVEIERENTYQALKEQKQNKAGIRAYRGH